MAHRTNITPALHSAGIARADGNWSVEFTAGGGS
jgi:hypothetical protein